MFAQDSSRSHTPVSSIVAGSYYSEGLKRTFDVVLSISLTAFAVPVIVAAWCLVRVTSAGPGFYTQTRVGRNGKHYLIYKIRTMRHNCEVASGAAWSHKGDTRVTGIGRVLRKLHIDELPQLLNVLRGDMSLIGPRPERPEFVGPLSEKIPNYTQRLQVRPGVTGLAQIQLPPDQDLESVRHKILLDRCYIQQRGFWLDLRILLGTSIYLLGFSYYRVYKLLALPNPLMVSAKPVRSKTSPAEVVGPFQINAVFPGAETSNAEPATALTLNGSPIACSEAQ